MQINRTQNQPNFRAKTMFPDAVTMAQYLKKRSVDTLEQQAKKIENIGDDATTMHVILFNPSKRNPYGVFTEIKDQSGRRAIKLRENLRLSQLSCAAQKSFERAQEELCAAPAIKKLRSHIESFQNRVRIQELANSHVYKTNMPQHPQRPQ